jgi:transcriptional regulator with XRE-family HTH domain
MQVFLFRKFVNFLLRRQCFWVILHFEGGDSMTLGQKIKRIRTFRGLTQKDFGMAIGLDEKTAANRIAQYESNYRTPKQQMLDDMARILSVNPINFHIPAEGAAEHIMQTLFWLDEDVPRSIRLFQLVKNPGKPGKNSDKAVRYNDSEDWPARAPVGLYFEYFQVDDFLREWLIRQNELDAGEITRDEFFEWKLNWPYTCDDCGKHIPMIPWRKQK